MQSSSRSTGTGSTVSGAGSTVLVAVGSTFLGGSRLPKKVFLNLSYHGILSGTLFGDNVDADTERLIDTMFESSLFEILLGDTFGDELFKVIPEVSDDGETPSYTLVGPGT